MYMHTHAHTHPLFLPWAICFINVNTDSPVRVVERESSHLEGQPETSVFLMPSASLVVQTVENAGDPGSIPRSGRSPREGNGNPLQYSAW